ncbi:hypothetical protein THTE_2538 [Thermogutta terrifontis]|uniref:Uncharacterized protein n=1 Tax=Thermogutta terrifontis TaxID=1331910 RepID=A0A286RGR1_9BACT|nr:hypothetical protein THTE_2538 [Thermogutta terrifontis]
MTLLLFLEPGRFRWLKVLERCDLTDVPQRMCVKDQDCRR